MAQQSNTGPQISHGTALTLQPCHGLTVQSGAPPTTGASAWRRHHTFARDTTESIIRHCKRNRFSVTAFVYAALPRGLLG